MKSGFGSILSEWRAVRRLSQLDLALTTGISQRHISFVESGRAQPSRDMIFKLAAGLDLPLRARNDLFLAAGYAPAYPERRLDLAEMKPARAALELILGHHEPYPALVTDGSWNIVMQNAAASRILDYCLGAGRIRRLFPEGAVNFMRLMFSEKGMRPHVLNWTHTRAALLNRLRRELDAGAPDPDGEDMSDENCAEPMLSLELRVGHTSGPILTFASLLSGHFANVRIKRTTSKHMFLVEFRI